MATDTRLTLPLPACLPACLPARLPACPGPGFSYTLVCDWSEYSPTRTPSLIHRATPQCNSHGRPRAQYIVSIRETYRAELSIGFLPPSKLSRDRNPRIQLGWYIGSEPIRSITICKTSLYAA